MLYPPGVPHKKRAITATAKRLKAYCKFQKLLGNPKPEGYTAQKDPDNLSYVCHGQVTSWCMVTPPGISCNEYLNPFEWANHHPPVWEYNPMF